MSVPILIGAENGHEIAGHLVEAFAHFGCAAPDYRVATSAVDVGRYIAQAPIVLAQPAWVAPHLDHAQQLRWLQSTFAGVEPLLQPQSRHDYVLTGVKGIFGPLISEYVFAAILQHSRHFTRYQAAQRLQDWQPIPYQALNKKTLAVMGLGSIGQHVVKTAKHFGMKVVGVNRSGAPLDGVDVSLSLSTLTDELRDADFVVLTLPATAETHQLVNRQFIAQLKPEAVLINVGRGALIHEPDLYAALQKGEIAGAVLDVFCEEPLPKNHPLWTAANVSITPHVAAVTFAKDIAWLFAENYRRWQCGQVLNNVIDFKRGY